ncbi:MAG: hypothetical protein LBM06_06950 [Prevotellaceae bacterium]|jgi:hypothetical protein|nr:hypothetical protein [Prevotellaceae bacterium]
MKKNIFLLAGTALCCACWSLSSCNSDEVDYTHLPKDAKLSLALQGSSPQIETRATATDFPTNEGNLQRITVGVFFANGSTNVIEELEAGQLTAGATTPNILCAAGNGQTVIVVANTPASLFAGASTKADFIAKKVSLQQTVSGGNTWQTADNLPMSGENIVDIAPGSTPTKATVSLSRLVARVSVGSIRTEFAPTGQYGNATFKLTDIYAYNVPTTSNVESGTTLFPVTTNFTGGMNDTGVPVTGSEYLMHSLNKAAAGGSSANLINGARYWFYTFANQEGTQPADVTTPHPLKLVIKGEFDADGNGSKPAVTVHYPIVVNKAQAGTSFTGGDSNNGNSNVYRNATYDVSVVIRGKGSDSPEEDVEQAYLVVSVNVAPWAINLTQEVIFD